MQQPAPIVLKDAYKQYLHDQDKVITPVETIARFKQRLAESGLKILDKIVRIDNGRLGIPVYFSLCGPDARAAIGNNKQMGKGASPEQSQASAVMELGERFSLFSFYRNPANFIQAPLSALKEPAIGFDSIARSVSDESDDLPAARKIFTELPLKWTWSHQLNEGRTVLVPFDWFWTINEFNGSSAGNCNEEAACQGICEIVERHVSALVSRQHRKIPRIETDSIQDPVARELMARYEKAGIRLCLSDFTCEMGIPSIGALAWDPATFPQKSEIVWTAGTMPGANKALCRALTEVAQLAGDFNSGGNYVASGLPKFGRLEEADYVLHPGRSIRLNALPDLSDTNIKVEVERCIGALADRKLDIFLVDVRHPALNIPAFYTIVPGTQFRERAAFPSVGMMCAKLIAANFPAESAIRQLMQIDADLPGKYYVQFYLGQVHLNRGDCEAALAHLHQAAALNPPEEDLAGIYTYTGLAHKDRGHYAQALGALEKADKIDPQRTDTLNLMGFCHFKQKAFEEAVGCFKRVIALNPSSAIDYANLAVNHRALGQTAEAIEFYQLALALDPGIDFAREHLTQLGVA
ncbi:MAG: tetratricopeptide repeat protein [Desulfobacteraceae bacterium]|nr:MAG: tetratricopeptide repeat protein [Desulfobacteraceae bacterium]